MSRMQKVDVTGCWLGAATPVLVPLTHVHTMSAADASADTSAMSRWPRSLFFNLIIAIMMETHN